MRLERARLATKGVARVGRDVSLGVDPLKLLLVCAASSSEGKDGGTVFELREVFDAPMLQPRESRSKLGRLLL